VPQTFQLQVATPEKVLYSGLVHSIVAPGEEGYLGVLPNHAPLVCALAIGDLTITHQDGTKSHIAVHRGILEVFENTVSVLADTAESAAEIDEQRAQRALERARNRLRERPPGTDLARAQAARDRALNRLKVKQR